MTVLCVWFYYVQNIDIFMLRRERIIALRLLGSGLHVGDQVVLVLLLL